MKKFKKYTVKARGSSVLENTGEIIFYFGIISGAIIIILSIDEDILLAVIGVTAIVSSIVFKAFATTIVSINDNLEALKQYKKIEYEESRKIEENEPFDPLTE